MIILAPSTRYWRELATLRIHEVNGISGHPFLSAAVVRDTPSQCRCAKSSQ